jgi:hypothetical protein
MLEIDSILLGGDLPATGTALMPARPVRNTDLQVGPRPPGRTTTRADCNTEWDSTDTCFAHTMCESPVSE